MSTPASKPTHRLDEGSETPPDDIDEIIKKITPSDEELIGLTEKFPPPQEWFDTDEECPF